MNLPVDGEPLEIPEFFRADLRSHLHGVAGGGIWAAGLVAALVAVAGALPAQAQTGPAVAYGLREAAAPLAALWGIAVWKELRGADALVAVASGLMIILFAAGIVVLAIAPRYAAAR